MNGLHFKYVRIHGKELVSNAMYAVWSLSDKNETSAYFKPGTEPVESIGDANLTESRLWVRYH